MGNPVTMWLMDARQRVTLARGIHRDEMTERRIISLNGHGKSPLARSWYFFLFSFFFPLAIADQRNHGISCAKIVVSFASVYSRVFLGNSAFLRLF